MISLKDENIKEILSLLNSSSWSNEAKQIEDYITNLQTIEQQYSAILSENAELKNKISDLQKDLDYQRQAEQEYNEKHTKLMNKYKNLQEENERVSNLYQTYEEANDLWIKKYEDYKSRNKKAIEYIKQQDMKYYGAVVDNKMKIILNILQGEDKDVKD